MKWQGQLKALPAIYDINVKVFSNYATGSIAALEVIISKEVSVLFYVLFLLFVTVLLSF